MKKENISKMINISANLATKYQLSDFSEDYIIKIPKYLLKRFTLFNDELRLISIELTKIVKSEIKD